MFKSTALFASGMAAFIATAAAQSPLLGELELEAGSKVERDAGVWLDGQYVGVVGKLKGGDGLVLVPGSHQLRFELIGYESLVTSVTVEPDQKAEYIVSMVPNSDLAYPSKERTAQLRIYVEPPEAAVFIDEAFVGHVDRYDDRGGMRILPGTYRFTIALPGYETFHTELTMRAQQTYEIKTELARANLSDQAEQLTADTLSRSGQAE